MQIIYLEYTVCQQSRINGTGPYLVWAKSFSPTPMAITPPARARRELATRKLANRAALDSTTQGTKHLHGQLKTFTDHGA